MGLVVVWVENLFRVVGEVLVWLICLVLCLGWGVSCVVWFLRPRGLCFKGYLMF